MESIKIGKNAIENLTIGMYEDSTIIYREYIQNAADAIDKAYQLGMYNDEEPFIDVSIDEVSRSIKITDNAMGIKKSEIHKKLADIADSDKEKGIDKGFRGIGRLGGLAYCDTLKFKTTFKGENTVTIMSWDAKELTRMINDNSIKYSAEEVLSRVISYHEEICDDDEHYFIVELINIREENYELLNETEVRKYISTNAPVPYINKFIFRELIYKNLKDNNLQPNEYMIFVNGADVFKNYSTILYDKTGNQKKKYDEIDNIEIKEFRNSKDELLAWMWFGISTFDKQIPPCNEMRGIRLRKENIQIGSSETLVRLFKEQRGIYYFIGELHAVHKELIPNAHRDYFNENQTRVEFEEEVKSFFWNELHKIYTDANKVKVSFKKEIALIDKKIEYDNKSKNGFIDSDEQEKVVEQVRVATEDNEQAKKIITNIKSRSKNDVVFTKIIDLIERKHNLSIKHKVPGKETVISKQKPAESAKKPTLISGNLHKLTQKQQKLISRVYGVINNVLPPEMSGNLIKKIEEELNK